METEESQISLTIFLNIFSLLFCSTYYGTIASTITWDSPGLYRDHLSACNHSTAQKYDQGRRMVKLRPLQQRAMDTSTEKRMKTSIILSTNAKPGVNLPLNLVLRW